MTCDGSEQLGPCSGQAVGAMISGVPGTAWKSDAYALTPRDDYRALLTEWFGSALPDEGDDLGDGSPRLAAIAREDSSGEYYAIATLIDDTGPATGIQRQSRTFRFAAANGDWQLAGDILGAVSYTSLDWLSGACSECYDYFERWP